MEATVGGGEGSGCPIRRRLGSEIADCCVWRPCWRRPRTCRAVIALGGQHAADTGRPLVIDWENCGLADPAQELPMAMIDFGLGDQRRIAELYLAYDGGGPARISGFGSFTMVIAQFGHFWESASPLT